ncbi:MAG: hypothetical protein V3V39_13730, partial [Desulfobacterales bacterium]
LVIEPIFEANFLDCSHGFRPGRSAHDAIRIIGRTITFKGQRIVVDADIVGFFGNICQDILLDLVERRIADGRVLSLIRMWLEAGVMEEGKYIEANEGMEVGLKPTGKPVELLPTHIATAPRFYSTTAEGWSLIRIWRPLALRPRRSKNYPDRYH